MKEQQAACQTQQYKDQIQDSEQVYPIQLLQTQVLNQTIIADLTTNKKFLSIHFKITVWLLLIIMFMKILPSPIIIKTFQNQPDIFTKETCNDNDCQNISQQGYQSITIKKVNPLQRELKYFVHINQGKINQFSNIFQKSKLDLSSEITWIQIYAVRDNSIYGQVIYQKPGKDVNEVIFNNKPLFFVGEIHILNEVSYMIKIYKIIHKYKTKETLRMLEDGASNKNQSNTIGNRTSQANQTTNSDESNNTNIGKNQTNSSKEVQKQISVPLTVQLVRYSQFYTGVQLLIRYVTLLIILYVAAETADCPKIFRIILFFTSNPLIFTEIAFPNTASNIISNMCSSMYVLYVPIFLFYTHSKLPNSKIDIAVKTLKFLISLGLYLATIARSMHLSNQSTIENIQYVLIAAVMIPIAKYLWRMYFIRRNVVLHRDMLFVVLTIYYFSLLFFSGYIVQYGWKKIIFYLIIQTYGVGLCYLTSPKLRSSNKKKPQQISNLSPNPQIQQHISNHSNHSNTIGLEPNSAKSQQKYKQQLYAQQLFVNIP